MGEPKPTARRNVRYKRALIARIDILGFKDLIDSSATLAG